MIKNKAPSGLTLIKVVPKEYHALKMDGQTYSLALRKKEETIFRVK